MICALFRNGSGAEFLGMAVGWLERFCEELSRGCGSACPQSFRAGHHLRYGPPPQFLLRRNTRSVLTINFVLCALYFVLLSDVFAVVLVEMSLIFQEGLCMLLT